MIPSLLHFSCLNSECEKIHIFEIEITHPGRPEEKPSRESPGWPAELPEWKMYNREVICCDCGVLYTPKFIEKYCQELFERLLKLED